MIALAESPHLPDARPTRRRAARSPKADAVPRQKVSLYLSGRAAKVLGVTATMEGKSMSDLVEGLIADHLKRWVVSDRAKPGDPATVPGSASDAA